MTVELEQMTAVFKQFVEAGLIEHNPKKALSVVTDDIIGIGMGEQGMVSCKADAARIIGDDKADPSQTTVVSYKNMLVRCYEDRFGTVCGLLKITTSVNGKFVTSTLGQLMSMRKEHGKWLIYALQATPIFEEIEELEAYPIKFAENVLETYRQQEQIAKNVQSDSVGVYLVNFSKGIFENSVLRSELMIRTEKGEQYERILFGEVRKHLSDEDWHRFIATFSLGNVLGAYQDGRTELLLDYEMITADERTIWMRTIVKLYTDKFDEQLKGYLYVIDIDKEKRREMELQRKTELDSMTGLYNKKYAELKIEALLSDISSANQGALFMIDLDFFKGINDNYGHQEGDRMIRETASCILSLSRKQDIAGRLGGDEFCIFYHGDLSPETIAQRADTLCRAVRSISPYAAHKLSCSIGIALCAKAGLTFEAVYKMADQALYRQKKNGRNGYTIYPNDRPAAGTQP